MIKKVNPYTPTIEQICIIILYSEKVWAKRFHGNPVNKYPLKISLKVQKIEKKTILKIKFVLNL